MADLLPIAGITPLTTIDFPGRLAMVIYTQGCPWRCPYCHNSDLQSFVTRGKLPWRQVMADLERRRGFLDGVVFSGGEPTCHLRLGDALGEVRSLGYAAALHTAGIFPKRLATLLPLLDWVGLDIKAPFDRRYETITGMPGSGDLVRESLEIVKKSGVAYQLRTTVSPKWTSAGDLADLQADLHDCDAPESLIQEAR